MFNNINNENNGYLFNNSQLSNASNIINLASVRANLQKAGYSNNPYVDKTDISANALELFQKDLDIKKFTKIALEDDSNSHMDKMQELFKDGIVDPFETDVLKELASNKKLWDDLSL